MDLEILKIASDTNNCKSIKNHTHISKLKNPLCGDEIQIELIMEKDGSKLKASIPGVFLPDAETPLWLSMRRDRCFVFLK